MNSRQFRKVIGFLESKGDPVNSVDKEELVDHVLEYCSETGLSVSEITSEQAEVIFEDFLFEEGIIESNTIRANDFMEQDRQNDNIYEFVKGFT